MASPEGLATRGGGRAMDGYIDGRVGWKLRNDRGRGKGEGRNDGGNEGGGIGDDVEPFIGGKLRSIEAGDLDGMLRSFQGRGPR